MGIHVLCFINIFSCIYFYVCLICHSHYSSHGFYVFTKLCMKHSTLCDQFCNSQFQIYFMKVLVLHIKFNSNNVKTFSINAKQSLIYQAIGK